MKTIKPSSPHPTRPSWLSPCRKLWAFILSSSRFGPFLPGGIAGMVAGQTLCSLPEFVAMGRPFAAVESEDGSRLKIVLLFALVDAQLGFDTGREVIHTSQIGGR